MTIGTIIKEILENQPRIEFIALPKVRDEQIYILKAVSKEFIISDMQLCENVGANQDFINCINGLISELEDLKQSLENYK